METENINNYSEMSIEDLKKLKEDLLDQKSSLNMNALDNTGGVIDLDVETEN